ncbi:MAG TPA: phosphatidylserine/phosphatidylglycerophosphate/cardiolipin synthase family protein [Gaiellaceae bacterium]|nr:phosphatidylserine/phosphatidylglycerophosphate/cardiolipin synthase family protein [Gaiellaceae bacterium]
MAIPRIDRLDDAVGAGIERLVVAHHRRRLRRHGWRHAYAPPQDGLWCAGDPPPRDGNAIEVLVDGEDALGRLQAEIEGAQESVHLAGWHFDPSFRLVEDGPPLRDLLAATAERAEVRLLQWAGAPLPLFTPSRAQVRASRVELVRGTRTRLELDARERPMHCHHEKLAVVDGRVAYVGGIDLTALAGNRLDSSEHPPRRGPGWHDAAARVEGPLVGDVAAHFALRWREVAGETLASNSLLQTSGPTTAQFVRTVPNGVYDALPRGDFRILEAYIRALRSAERLVYLESQFLWSPELVRIVAAKLRNPPSDEFRVIVLLPARPNNGGDDTRGQLGLLIDADRHDRLLASTLYQPGGEHQVYVHAKIGIVDDRWLAIGSANLNEHSLYNDTEACVITTDENLVRTTRLKLWREHLQHDEPTFDLWRERAEDDGYERVAPLPHLSRRTRRFLGPINGLLVDG